MQLLKLNDLIRIGRNYDGGYVIAESLMKRSSVLLSFGINDDWSFEEDFYQKSGIRCLGFDFSVHKKIFLQRTMQQVRFFIGDIIKRRKIGFDRWKEARRNYLLHVKFNSFFRKGEFQPYGIDNSTHDQFMTMDDILEKYLRGKNDIFLKVDIEGYEFRIIDDILRNKDRFHSFAMEIHHIHDKVKGFSQFFEKIQQHFYVYHLHANNYGDLRQIDGYPDVIEISCIRKDLVDSPSFCENLSHLPIVNFDYPNDPASPDFKW
jgi:hypothetical protein